MRLIYARAAARLGNADGARAAITAAHDVRDRAGQDDVAEIGGEFSFTRASEHYFAGSALTSLPDSAAEAIGELERAIELYDAEPGPGEQHSAYCMLAARVDLATAGLRAGRLDAAAVVLDPVLGLDPGRRVSSLLQSFGRARGELHQPVYRGSAVARGLGERIEEFCRQAVAAGSHGVPGGW